MIFQNELVASMQRNRDNIAIEYGEKRISYLTLSEKAAKVTARLLHVEVPCQTVIGVRLHDRADIISTIIGIMNARCLFYLIDDRLPPARLEKVFSDLGLKYLISSVALSPLNSGNYVDLTSTMYLEDLAGETGYFENCLPDYDEQDGVYIYYTSGSTGTPKGIIGKNSGLLQFLKWEIEAFGINSSFRISQLTSPYFDAFLRDVFSPLIVGATICIPADEENIFVPGSLADWISANRINLVHCVPSVFRLLNSAEPRPDLQHLKYILLSGEKIVPQELSNWYSRYSDAVQLVNLYGLTETTMIRFCYRIRPEDVHLERIPIGRPIDETSFLIAGENLKPCGKLVPGELYIISDYTAKGYYNDLSLTEERFLKYQTPAGKNTVAFKTGDMARMLLNGNIELLGRKDKQIKRNGIRINLDEIEILCNECELVELGVAYYQELNAGISSLQLFFKGAPGYSTPYLLTQAEKWLKDRLPEYMLPDQLHLVEHFPLLPNGKIDYIGLSGSITVEDITAPRNDIEARLLRIWQEILGDHQISIQQNFLKAGGNSLGIMRLIGKIFTEFKVRISLNQIFGNLTIAEQSVLILEANRGAVYKINQAEPASDYPLSSSQKGMYYNYELDRDTVRFNMPIVFQVSAQAEISAIARALFKLTERHEILRTRFRINDGDLTQTIQAATPVHIAESFCAAADLNGHINEQITAFDLSKGPLIRSVLINTDDGNRFLMIDLHHIVCDGISQMILFEDFLKFYEGADLAPLAYQYKDYAAWESQFKQTDEFISQREFWLKCFESNVPKLSLPTLVDEQDEFSGEGGNVEFSIARDEITPILNAFGDTQVTVFSILFAAYFTFLAQLSGQDDIVVGTVSSGRTQEELEGMVGMFVKTLPVRYQVNGGLSFKDFAVNFHRFMVEANSKHVYDIVDIVSEINRKQPVPVKRLFDVMFVYLDFHHQNSKQEQQHFSVYNYEKRNSKYPLTLFVYNNPESFDFRFEYSKLSFSEGDIKSLAAQFESLLASISVGVNEPVNSLVDFSSAVPATAFNDISFNF
jgi:mycobactin peptide synthetase MbtE